MVVEAPENYGLAPVGASRVVTFFFFFKESFISTSLFLAYMWYPQPPLPSPPLPSLFILFFFTNSVSMLIQETGKLFKQPPRFSPVQDPKCCVIKRRSFLIHSIKILTNIEELQHTTRSQLSIYKRRKSYSHRQQLHRR